MDEQPQEPVERRHTVERQETVERQTMGTAETAPQRRPSLAWLWVLLLLLVVGALAWYALSRGEPADLEVPEIDAPELEAPRVEPPDPEPNVEIEVNDPTAAPAREPE